MTTAVQTLDSAVREAATAFAQALADSPEFRAFEESYHTYKHSPSLQDAVHRLEESNSSLDCTTTNEEGSSSERERQAREYVEARDKLMLLCQRLVQGISAGIELDFASACSTSCCG